MKRPLNLYSLAVLVMLAACATSTPSATSSATSTPSLTSTIERLAATPPLDHAVWGIDVEDDAGRQLVNVNAHRLMIPASNRKLFASATVAECLGLDTRFSTELWLDGADVVLRGDGDPSFGAVRRESRGFAPLITALKQRRVTAVHDVVVDVSRFDRVILPGSWKLGNIGSDYSAPVDAITWQENAVGDNSVADPAVFARENLRDQLLLAGIHVDGRVRTLTAGGPCSRPSPACVRVDSVESPYVFDLLTAVLKNSQNLYAETLLKRSSPSGSYDESLALERAFITSQVGVDPAEFEFHDGSGLSPEDLAAPAAIVKVLRWMDAPVRRGVWWAMLAQPGSEGTLHRRVADLGPRMRGKTGTINGVNAISGIVRGRNGGTRYFSLILDHSLAESGVALNTLDAMIETIADF